MSAPKKKDQGLQFLFLSPLFFSFLFFPLSPQVGLTPLVSSSFKPFSCSWGRCTNIFLLYPYYVFGQVFSLFQSKADEDYLH